MSNKFLSLEDFLNYFKDEATCIQYLESKRFKDGEFCPYCSFKNNVYRIEIGYKCPWCSKTFSIRQGTIFHRSHISLRKWFTAIFLLYTENISSAKLARDLNITQKTAWFMSYKIKNKLITKKDYFFDHDYFPEKNTKQGKVNSPKLNPAKQKKIKKKPILKICKICEEECTEVQFPKYHHRCLACSGKKILEFKEEIRKANDLRRKKREVKREVKRKNKIEKRKRKIKKIKIDMEKQLNLLPENMVKKLKKKGQFKLKDIKLYFEFTSGKILNAINIINSDIHKYSCHVCILKDESPNNYIYIFNPINFR